MNQTYNDGILEFREKSKSMINIIQSLVPFHTWFLNHGIES